MLLRLRTFGAPPFSWEMFRRPVGTDLTCAPGISDTASAFLSAKRLGHSVLVAEKHYTGAITDIPPTAKTLEAAMGIDAEVEHVIAAVSGPRPDRKAAGAEPKQSTG